MTEDRDFKKVVRQRSAKTGESYQAAKRQLTRKPERLFGHVSALWEHPAGLVLGLRVEEGQVELGMPVAVTAGDRLLHEGTVASLRVAKQDRSVVSSGDCGILLDPPFYGFGPSTPELPNAATGFGALRPVQVAALPWTVIG